MTYYAQFNTQGFVVGFYDDLSAERPESVVQITEEQYLELLAYQGLCRWDGEKVVEYTPPKPTQEELRETMTALTPRQFRDTLIDNDIMPDQVTSAIGIIPDVKQRAKALNAWEYSTQFTRTDPLIDQIGAMFDLSPGDIDAMWNAALAV